MEPVSLWKGGGGGGLVGAARANRPFESYLPEVCVATCGGAQRAAFAAPSRSCAAPILNQINFDASHLTTARLC
jgi:hypothetical protein